jgi:hypothetical protein
MCNECRRKEDELVGRTGHFLYCGGCSEELHRAEVDKAERLAARRPPA